MHVQVSRIVLACVVTVIVLPQAVVLAQWSPNAADNLAIADRTGEQVQPKVCGTSDGGCYISWFDNAAGGYDVFLQRLSPGGCEQWAHNGIPIANRSYDWTMDYGLAVDADDNAILVYNDDRSGDSQIGCNKISPDGTLLWNTLGVQLTDTTDYVASPRVAVTSDGYYVFAWSQADGYCLQKLDAAGVPQWNPAVYVAPSTGSFDLSDLHEADDGSVIVSCVYWPTFYTHHLYAQKHSSSGTPLWGLTPIAVFDGGSLQFGCYPTFEPDCGGGAVFSWYDTGDPRNVYVQHIDGSGGEVFPHNGVAVSTLTYDRIRLDPSAAYNAATGETFVFWTETDSYQTVWGLYGQKLSPTGSRMWTNTGCEVLPLTAAQNTFVRTLICESGAIVLYSDNPSNTNLMAVRLDGSGTEVWPVSPSYVSNAQPGAKWDTDAILSPFGTALVVWTDTRSDNGSIYAQNLAFDGTLGLIPGDLDGNGDVDFADAQIFLSCMAGPEVTTPPPGCDPADFEMADLDGDGDVDRVDFDMLQHLFGG